MGNDYMSSGLEWEMRDEARSAGELAELDDDHDYPDPQQNPYKGCRCAGSETGPCDYCEWEPDEPTPSKVAVEATQGILDSMHKIMTAIIKGTNTQQKENQ